MNRDPPGDETEQYWKSIWEKEASHKISAQWFGDLSTDHRDLQEQDLVNIAVAGIQKKSQEQRAGQHHNLKWWANEAAGTHQERLTQGRTPQSQYGT